MTTITEPVSLAEQITSAEAATAEPRQRVAGLQAELHAAIAAGQFDRAHALQADVAAAREEYAIADARAAALRAGADRVRAEREAADRQVAEAEQRAQAEQELATAHSTEQRGLDQIADALAAMWQAINSAQRHLRAAQAGEHAVGVARQDQITAQGRLGAWPSGDPGPTPSRPNQASVLVESDPLIRALAGWSR